MNRLVTLMPNRPVLEIVSQRSTQKLRPAAGLAADKDASQPAGSKLFGRHG